MISYKALTRASITLQLIDDIGLYDSEIFSSNGLLLQPYDRSTTLTGIIYKNNKDITSEIEDIRWTIWSPDSMDYRTNAEWNENHKGSNVIEVTSEEINGKCIIQFEAYKRNKMGEDDLIACSHITLVDINDLIAVDKKPTAPYDGQLWVDTSTEPATIWVFKNGRWTRVGTVDAIVKNLIRNSAFTTFSPQYYDVVGNTALSYTPYVFQKGSYNWLKVQSDVVIDSERGVSYTVFNEDIKPNSDYSFQMLMFATSEAANVDNRINVRICSVDDKDKEVPLYEYKDIQLSTDISKFFTSFKTISTTKTIKIYITGHNNSIYDFNISHLALYNTGNDYPWQAHPDDGALVLDQETLFNTLTNNGTVKGLYSIRDPQTGQLQIYFNANYIQSGTVKGDYIDARNLTVTRDDGVKTLEITDKGEVNLVVNSFRLSATGQTIEEFIIESIDLNDVNQLRYLLKQIQKESEEANEVYTELYNTDELKDAIYSKQTASDLDLTMYAEGYVSGGGSDEPVQTFALRTMSLEESETTEPPKKRSISVDPDVGGEELLPSFVLGVSKIGYAILGETGRGNLKTILRNVKRSYDNDAYYLKTKIEQRINELENRESSMLMSMRAMTYADDPIDSIIEEYTLDELYTIYIDRYSLLNRVFIICQDAIGIVRLTVVTDQWSKFEVETNKILSEVGEVKKYYVNEDGEEGTLLEAIGAISAEYISPNAIVNVVKNGIVDPDTDPQKVSEVIEQTIMEQTANKLGITSENLRQGLSASFDLSVNGIKMSTADADGNVTLLDMNGNHITISSEYIDLNGYVTFSKFGQEFDKNFNPSFIDSINQAFNGELPDVTTIDGGMITTGTLMGNRIVSNTITTNQLATNVLVADNIKSGNLQGLNTNSFFNLDEGTFQLADASGKSFLSFDGTKLAFAGANIKDLDITIDELTNNDIFPILPNWVQDWSGRTVEIDGENIVGVRAFLGHKEEGELTGVGLGVDLGFNSPEENIQGNVDSGIVGLRFGQKTFELNLDGTFKFGNDSRYISFDDEGLKVSDIYGEEIRAYNLEVYLRSKDTEGNNVYDKNNKTFAIDDSGNVTIKANEFSLTPTSGNQEQLLYGLTNSTVNSETNGIWINNGKLNMNAANVTVGQMSAGRVNITDGEFLVGTEEKPIFWIKDTDEVIMKPSQFLLADSEDNTIIELDANKNVTINGDYVNAGAVRGDFIAAGTIDITHLVAGTGTTNLNNILAKENVTWRSIFGSETYAGVILNCELGRGMDENITEGYYVTGVINPDKVKEVAYIEADLGGMYKLTSSTVYFDYVAGSQYYYKIKYSCNGTDWYYAAGDIYQAPEGTIDASYGWRLSPRSDGSPTPTINNFSDGIENDYINARFVRLYIGNYSDKPITARVYSWQLYTSGKSTVIDGTGILTGSVTANQIAADAISTKNININDDSFTFKNEKGDLVFGIEKVVTSFPWEDLETVTTVTMQPDTFTLKYKYEEDGETKTKNGILLKDGKLSIDATSINTGEFNADLIKTGTLDAKVIKSKSITSDKIDGKGLTITREGPDGKPITTFKIDQFGTIYANYNDFILVSGDDEMSVGDYTDALRQDIGEYIRFSKDTIILGKEINTDGVANKFRAELSPQSLDFMENGVAVASISNNRMFITNAQVKNIMTIGDSLGANGKTGGFFDWTVRQNGHLTLKWRDS